MDKVKRILIISSDDNLREILKFCLDGWGYEVFLWDSCEEDVSLIKRISPDVIVVDVHSARQPDLKICSILKEDFISPDFSNTIVEGENSHNVSIVHSINR